MTVAELIAKLRKYPPETQVFNVAVDGCITALQPCQVRRTHVCRTSWRPIAEAATYYTWHELRQRTQKLKLTASDKVVIDCLPAVFIAGSEKAKR